MPLAARSQGAKTSPASTASAGKTPQGRADRTTLSGVYTRDDADYGKEMYAGLCASCHKAIAHTGPTFRKKWAGRPLSDLYMYMRTLMPKNEPASLADEDYAALLSYMLQMNQMPAGKTSLSTDTLELAKIRIDMAVAVRKRP
jgi:mono/diheme cytochrome c family protein